MLLEINDTTKFNNNYKNSFIMILKKILSLSFFILSNSLVIAQSHICESSSSDDILMELNSIDKCLNENLNTDNTMPKVRAKRYLKTRGKKNLNTIINAPKNNTTRKEIIIPDFYLSEITEQPVLLTSKSNSNYKGDLKKVLDNYIKDNLKYPSDLKEKGIEGIVWASFVIDTNGNVKKIVALGPINSKLLEQEATRIIKSLPKFSPGKLDGKPVNVKHLTTINFELK